MSNELVYLPPAGRRTWIQRQMPNALLHHRNPIFGYMLRVVGYDTPMSQLPGRSVRLMGYTALTLLVFWITLAALSFAQPSVLGRGNSLTGYPLYGSLFVGALALFTLISTSLLDFRAYNATHVYAINVFKGGQWRLVMLTPFLPGRFVLGLHAAIQVLIWRWVCVFTGLRLVLWIIAPIHIMLLMNPLPRRDIDDTATLLFVVIPTTIIIGMWMVQEPVWRARLMTAISLNTISNRESALLTQAVIVMIMVVYNVAFYALIAFVVYVYTIDLFGGGGLGAWFGTLILVFSPLVYRQQTRFWLRRAERHLRQLDVDA